MGTEQVDRVFGARQLHRKPRSGRSGTVGVQGHVGDMGAVGGATGVAVVVGRLLYRQGALSAGDDDGFVEFEMEHAASLSLPVLHGVILPAQMGRLVVTRSDLARRLFIDIDPQARAVRSHQVAVFHTQVVLNDVVHPA